MATVPTLDDVAALVGVSTRTVSRVLRNEGGYSDATEQRVRDAVDELGYFPNLLARGLSERRSGTIGLIGPNMSDPFFPDLAGEIQRRALERGRTTFYASSFHDPDQQRTILASLRSYGMDAVVVQPVSGTRRDVERFAASGTPVVVIDEQWHGPGIASVSAELEHGARLAVAAHAVDLIDQLVERPDVDHGHVRVPVELVERESTTRVAT
ncbi:MAG: LacI family DNA-binding transcriptional regulator [Ilumatobacter sp.]